MGPASEEGKTYLFSKNQHLLWDLNDGKNQRKKAHPRNPRKNKGHLRTRIRVILARISPCLVSFWSVGSLPSNNIS